MTKIVLVVVGGCIGIATLIGIGMWGLPKYNVWERTLAGEAQLKMAEQNRKIKVAEAESLEEAAKHLANAEVTRAEGVAKANQIIGKSLHENEAYLRYLWIQQLDAANMQVIYVPTEANLPILEAGKRVTKE